MSPTSYTHTYKMYNASAQMENGLWEVFQFTQLQREDKILCWSEIMHTRERVALFPVSPHNIAV